ncbi:MAG: GNAT family N-acetyltransferase, partial [Actinomycetota bacterium]|nr:GNAT family N-acetyltransferase [Actinomycetota bacterium]
MTGSPPRGYPQHRVVHVPLRDGSTIAVRPVVPEDASGLAAFFGGLSGRSSHLRFHDTASVSVETMRRFAEVDYRESFSLVAEKGWDAARRLVAVASYFRSAPGRAEMALVVADDLQGLGLGSVLIEHLGEAAAEAGIATFEAEVLAANADMLEV